MNYASRLKLGTTHQRWPGEEACSPVEDDATESSLVITTDDQHAKSARRRAARRKRKIQAGEEDEREDEGAGGEMIDSQLDQSLENKSKQHNLTSVNVRNIIHEVITNEHVVAMMKAAINQTDAVPPFEPKMTRSKLKEVVEKGVVIPAWNISPIKKSAPVSKVPQFVDIPLAEEDSSDEEYRPDEEEEDETAEDTLQESDFESAASPPRGSAVQRPDRDPRRPPWKTSRAPPCHFRVGSGPMAPPPLPKAPPPKAVTDSTFLEKLHAVEEELAVCMEPYQCQPVSDDEVGLMAYRTRSKRPLRDVPLGQLEAELRAPDITPDMYDCGSAPEDREWTVWLRGLMNSDMDDEECDDEDDPEYNFLADLDEPDQEDYRDDKAVRITKKEVNELMEELFDTLKGDLGGQEVDEEGHEEEEPQEDTPTPDKHMDTQACDVSKYGHSGEAEDGPIRERRTVKQQLALIRSTQHTPSTHTHTHTLMLDAQQRNTLEQQLQQHVQLLVELHLLTSPVEELHNEAESTRHFLFELDVLAQRGELMMSSWRRGDVSAFRASNLRGALQLLDELQHHPISYVRRRHTPDARGQMRGFPIMPAELAWIFATRAVFLYPELLPCVSLDPALYCPRRTAAFTAAEDCLLVMGLRNMKGSCDPTKLVSEFLLGKSHLQVRRRILQCCRPGTPDNMVKAYRYQQVLWSMPLACSQVAASEQRPPVERPLSIMPLWLLRSIPVILAAIQRSNSLSGSAPTTTSFPTPMCYPPRPPPDLSFRRTGFVQHPPPPITPPLPTHMDGRDSEEAVLPVWHLSESSTCSASDVFVAEEAESESDLGVASAPAEDRGMSSPESSTSCPPSEQDIFRASSHLTTGRHLGDNQHEDDGRAKAGSHAPAHKAPRLPVFAKNVSMGVNGERLVIWTREADRAILTACQQRGANQKTFRQVSAQLGNKTTDQVRLRFHDLAHLFHLATQKDKSWSSDGSSAPEQSDDL
uniref:GON-4-like protein isoform X1 n=1 Tax=Doryrhamphus excisus TaxID=161450 RepID=UPI0025ADB502|nr:GON-4-like protein isoform X1 [Doryrhamphus excisus]XP_057903382.1 GON-4-like protein isoform X1 [Doryrhamphus excisus]XP_057903383.1 GON-4-like protein isoform X1 [Doryrhamphus excisus]XP_057903384.1 GON-4-like protein isoform X1 [Doryrhamphus excisus]